MTKFIRFVIPVTKRQLWEESKRKADALKRFAPLGTAPGKSFDVKALDPAVAKSLQDGVRSGLAQIAPKQKQGMARSLTAGSS